MICLARGRAAALLALALLAVASLRPARAEECANPAAAVVTSAAVLALSAAERATLRQFYDIAGNRCLWDDGARASLAATLAGAAGSGLDPARYEVAAPGAVAGGAAARDVAATAMALRYAHDMVFGRVDLAAIEANVAVPRPRRDLARELEGALAARRLGDWLAALPPAEPGYRRLLAAYRAFGSRLPEVEPAPVPPGRTLRLGDLGPRVALMQDRLRASGDLRVAAVDGRFDRPTQDALIAFQRRQGIAADGRLGRLSLAALNVPAAARLRQIALNLERWRYIGHVLPPRRIEINTAAATLRLVADGRTRLAMRVVDGDRRHPTPTLISPAVEAIILNPPWVVPRSIIRNEIEPRLARDPGYLARHNMAWRGDQLVQAPGPANSLGRIKFDFQNRFSVYLHDTPARALFALDDRARSHGCIRVEQPRELALMLLKGDPAWTPQTLEAAIAAGATRRIPIPAADAPAVVVFYWTAFVDDDGTLEFRDDLYGRDARLAAALGDHAPRLAAHPRIAGEIGCGSGGA